MRFIRADGTHREREPRYFVGMLGIEDFGYSDGYRYEIQLLDEDGRGFAVVQFRGDENPLACHEMFVPVAVFRAAMDRMPGQGEYVTSTGEVGRPF